MTMVQGRNVDVANDRSVTRKPGFRTQIIRVIELVNHSICYGYIISWVLKQLHPPLPLLYFPVYL